MTDILTITIGLTLLVLIAAGGGIISYLVAKWLIWLWEKP